jgi:hypothetical protein
VSTPVSERTSNVRIYAEPVIAKDLQPGDLFSMAPAEYWQNFPNMNSIGECVYIRTHTPSSKSIDGDDCIVYRITIEREE